MGRLLGLGMVYTDAKTQHMPDDDRGRDWRWQSALPSSRW